MTLASIVEKEVELSAERPVVAAVYWNRLRVGMALQADPTVLYALGKGNVRVYYKDLEVKSPYNTYRVPGLPRRPIADSPPGLRDLAIGNLGLPRQGRFHINGLFNGTARINAVKQYAWTHHIVITLRQ